MIDEAVHAWFQSQRHPLLTPLMLFVTYVHGTAGLLLLAALLAIVLWRRGERAWILALVASVPGAMLLNVGLKHLVRRARPVVEQPLLELGTYSFPSGHAAGAAALYGFAAAWLLAQPLARGQRVVVIAASALMMAWVDLSRVYLGVHYASDVLAGTATGLLWVLFCLAVLRARLVAAPLREPTR